MSEAREVLATLTEEENNKFEDIVLTRAAVKEMQDNLTAQLAQLNKEENNAWKEIYAKYGLSGNLELSLDRQTREITKRG